MNNHYYKEACMCRHPVPSRIIPQRCAWCGGILPPSVRLMHQLQEEMADTPTGGAIIAAVIAIILLAALVAVGELTLIASQYDPTPPNTLAQHITDTERR